MTIINQPPTTVIADNTTYNTAHGQLYWFCCCSADHFLCVSRVECVNFIITKSKHRKGNFISARCQCLCFERTFRHESDSWAQQFEVRVHLKMFVNQKVFTAHSVSCALTAQGGEAALKFTEMSTLVWSDWLKAVQARHRRYTVFPFSNWNFCSCCRITVCFSCFFSCGKKMLP